MMPPRIRVLLVEDNEKHAELFQQMLLPSNEAFFEVVHCRDLRQGIERLGTEGIDLILLDLTLPDSSGFATFARFLERAPRTPIIVLSGMDDEVLALQTVAEGAQDYLVKGHADRHVLVRAMRYAVERKRIQIELERTQAQLERGGGRGGHAGGDVGWGAA